MAISDSRASTIVDVSAAFGFDSFSCDPAEITAYLGIEPNEVGVKGHRRPTPANLDVVAGIAAHGSALHHDIYQVDQGDDEIQNEPGFSRLPKD